MPVITFVHMNSRRVQVKLDGRTVGYIERGDSGWQYMPQGRVSYAGEAFATLAECKRSVTGEA